MQHWVTWIIGRAHKSCRAIRTCGRKGRTAVADSSQQLLLQDAHGGLCTVYKVMSVCEGTHNPAAWQNDPLGQPMLSSSLLVSNISHVNILCPGCLWQYQARMMMTGSITEYHIGSFGIHPASVATDAGCSLADATHICRCCDQSSNA